MMFTRFFFLNDPATTEIYPLPLHAALPIYIVTSPPVHAAVPPEQIIADQGWAFRTEHPLCTNRRLSPGYCLVIDRKSTRLNSSHANISYAVFCLKKKKTQPSIKILVYLRLC